MTGARRAADIAREHPRADAAAIARGKTVTLHASRALLPQGWTDDVTVAIGESGRITAVRCGMRDAGAQTLRGPVVPGMSNVHSHAFQRAIAGRTGWIAGHDDTFWTWRDAMYRVVGSVDADAFHAITTQGYVEMALAGYTSVGEFHYVHHDRDGTPYADRAELSRRVIDAASQAGIGLTLLPVLYAHGGFGGRPPSAAQRRFVHAPDTFLALLAQLAPIARDADVGLGLAPHSLRAVTPEELRVVLAGAPPTARVHVHAAEQRREVDECVEALGRRPVEWLLEHAGVDEGWCLIHATHLAADEIVGLATSGAVVGLAPTTEADLGDGTFAATDFVEAGGRIGIGSDSNTVIDPFAELRALEWSQRLRLERRNCLGSAGRVGTLGTRLWSHAARSGAHAIGRDAGEIVVGRRADLVVLDSEDSTLDTADPEGLLDAAIFGPVRHPVRDVMIDGRWVVREGRHAAAQRTARDYRAAIERLFGEAR